MTDKALQFWSQQRTMVHESVASGSLRRYIVDSVENDTGYLILEDIASGETHDEPYLALDTPGGYGPGDYVFVAEVMARGVDGGSTRIVIGKPGNGASGRVFIADSQATADTPSTASVTTYASAITVPVVLSEGTWTIVASGSALMSHNVSQASWRVIIDGDASTPHTLAMTTEERFEAAHSVTGVDGGRTIDVAFQYRSFTAGTTSARNPIMRIEALRTG